MLLIKEIVADIAIIKKERLLIRAKKGVLSNEFDSITIRLNELSRELEYTREKKDTSKWANNEAKAKRLEK